MRVECVRKLNFCSGHRVMGHENKCANLHGHEYMVEVWCRMIEAEDRTDQIGRVIDFSVIKTKLGKWIEDNLDHGFMLHKDDIAAIDALDEFTAINNEGVKQKVHLLPYNPTAENIARYLIEEICPMLFANTGVFVTKIIVHETPNCRAEVEYNATVASKTTFA